MKEHKNLKNQHRKIFSAYFDLHEKGIMQLLLVLTVLLQVIEIILITALITALVNLTQFSEGT